MNEQRKYEVIKKLVEENGNKDRAAMTLGLSRRQINRLIQAYKEKGKAAFIHGNRGRKPATTIPEATRKAIVDLYRNKYYDANFTHFTELLESQEHIRISTGTVTSILESEYILSPRATKAKKKRAAKELRQKQVWHLHVAVDDATGRIAGAWFDTQETLSSYYHVLRQILTSYGIPYKFLTDRRTVFTYKKKNSPSTDEDTYTQFTYACKQLGILMESISVPQAKGRVERLNQTLQSRLPVELRLAGVTTIEATNEFLIPYIKEFNAKFSLPLNSTKSVFEVQPENEKINLILAVLDERTVDSGHCIQFEKQYYRMLDAPKPRRQYIPPMSHPWRRGAFGKFVKSQAHRMGDGVPAA